MRIIIKDDFNSIDALFSSIQSVGEEQKITEEVLLSEFDKGKIMSFEPNEYRNTLTRSQIRFLHKLKVALINNNPNLLPPMCEEFVDELARQLFFMTGIDDGVDLIMGPCILSLNIDEESFVAKIDHEGRRGSQIVWILCEDKHIKTPSYKRGDIQLGAGLIAAFQANRDLLGEIHPSEIVGMKAMGSYIYFYSMKMSSSYLEQLIDGLPKEDIVLNKYPKDGFRLEIPEERRKILECLEFIRNYALSDIVLLR